jgi:uncharacterized OsmC-like protein
MRRPAESSRDSTPNQWRTDFEQRLDALRNRPALAASTGRVQVTAAYGVACDVDLGDRSLRVDLPRDACGTGSGPHPGQLMRASLGACLVMGYELWAARLGVALHGVELELTCEYDERGQLGIEAATPIGWQRIRWSVTLLSDAPEPELMHVVETTHRLSPMLANLSHDIERTFEVRIRRSCET